VSTTAYMALAAAAAVAAPPPRARQARRAPSIFGSGKFSRFMCPLCRKSVRVEIGAKTLADHTPKWGARKGRKCRASGTEIIPGAGR
jgi:hypothetical protein